ncbi:MAG: ABC transporter permease [Planctomycetes bacterium]|nr:ABC transporter permease [Planctomycetota bacterium]
MTGLVRDLLRQRLRAALTVSGVALGMLTLVVLGALGEHFRALVDESKAYTRGVVRLFTKTNPDGINPGITDEALEAVRGLPAVAVVAPTLVLYLDGFDLEADPLSFATPRPLVEGLAPEHAATLRGGMPLVEGRWLRAGDERHAVVARWLAQRRGLVVGGPVTIRHVPYEVVGLYDAPDAPMVPAAVVPYGPLNHDFITPGAERARRALGELLGAHPLGPMAQAALAQEGGLEELARRFVEQQEALFRVYEVIPRDRSAEGTRRLAADLRATVPDLAVIDPDRIEQQMERAVALFLVVALIVTVISTVVGGLLIVNTMAMAVLERRREIGIKSAVGATPGQVALEFVAEAGVLGLVGAVLGVLVGVAAIRLAEPALLAQLESGSRLFLVTPRLVLLTVAYGGVLGVLAGGIPALRAARVDPAVVLREL